MSLASGRFSLGRRLATLLLFMAVAGCSTASSPLAANSDYDRDLRMFTAAYEDIDDLYIRKVDLENLALGGLSGLAAIDPDIAAKRNGDKIDILYKDETAAGLPIGDKFEADDWAALTAAGIAAARKASPVLAKADSEAIYKAVFNGMLARLNDPFSRYAGRDQAAENRASREGFGGIGVCISVEDGTVADPLRPALPAGRAGGAAPGRYHHRRSTALPTKGLDQQQVVSLLRGSVDSRVLLTIQRKSLAHPLVVAVTRVLVVPETVTYRREGDIAYFRIYQLQRGHHRQPAARVRECPQRDRRQHARGDPRSARRSRRRPRSGGRRRRSVHGQRAHRLDPSAATPTATSITRPPPATSPRACPSRS